MDKLLIWLGDFQCYTCMDGCLESRDLNSTNCTRNLLFWPMRMNCASDQHAFPNLSTDWVDISTLLAQPIADVMCCIFSAFGLRSRHCTGTNSLVLEPVPKLVKTLSNRKSCYLKKKTHKKGHLNFNTVWEIRGCAWKGLMSCVNVEWKDLV